MNSYNIIFSLLIFAATIYYLIVTLMNNLNIMQQSWYKNFEYLLWLENKDNRHFPRHKMLVFVLFLSSSFLYTLIIMTKLINIDDDYMTYFNIIALLISIFIFSSALFIRKLNKTRTIKNIVFTSRLKRLMYTNIILYFIVILWGICADLSLGYNELMITKSISFSLFIFNNEILITTNYLLSIYEDKINQKFVENAKSKMSYYPGKIITITGSFGKTSTKDSLYDILSNSKLTQKTPKNYNTLLGITKHINDDFDNLSDYFICEMSARYKDDIKKTHQLFKSDIAILTSLGHQHLDTFLNFENIKSTKKQIFDFLDKDGYGLINIDDKYLSKMKIKGKKIYTFGVKNSKADFIAKNIIFDMNGSAFDIYYKSKKINKKKITTKLLGEHQILNILSGFAIAFLEGIDINYTEYAIRNLKPTPNRLEIKSKENYIMIDDTYNSNEKGCIYALEALDKFKGMQKVVVTPGLIDLGDMLEKINKDFADKISEIADHVILVKNNSSEIVYKRLLSKKYDRRKIDLVDSVNDAFIKMKEISKSKKTVALFENDLPDYYF